MNHQKDLQWNIEDVVTFITTTSNNDLSDNEYFYITNKILYSEDCWDFRYVFRPKVNYTQIFDFGQLSSPVYKNLLKRIVIQQLLINKKRFTTVWYYFYYIRRFLLFIEKKLIFSVKDIQVYDLKAFLETLNYNNYASKSKLSSSLKLFFHECDLHSLNDNTNKFLSLLNNYALWSREKKFYKSGRTNNIPISIQKNIVNCAIKDIHNNQLSTRNRVFACTIIILFYTGMRHDELRSLEANKLREISIFDNTESAFMLEFLTFKTVREYDGKWTKAKAFPELVFAYKQLEKLTKPVRKQFDSKYLLLTSGGNLIGKTQILVHIDNFFHRNNSEIGFLKLSKTELLQVKNKKFGKTHYRIYGEGKYKEWINQYFYTISPHQFRVAFANNLKDKVTLEWVQEHMNHLSSEMTKYYFRDDEDIKETLIYKSNKEGSQLDLQLNDGLESDEQMEQACETINEFLSLKKLNIYTDIDEILDVFKNNPLNESIVGLCSKAVILLCERQNKLNTLENWYYNSPTIPSIASIDFTLKRFFEKCKIVKHNSDLSLKNKMYNRNYEIEWGSLNRFYVNKLLPEVKLLKQYIKENQFVDLIEQYPNVKHVVNNLNEVEEEVLEWRKVLQLKDNY